MAARARAGGSPPASQPPQQPGSSLYQKKSQYSAKQREGGTQASSGAARPRSAAREPQPGSILVRGGISQAMGGLKRDPSRARPGHRPAGGRRTGTEAGQQAGAKVPRGLPPPPEPVQSWSPCPGGFLPSSCLQPDFAVTVQPAPGARNAAGAGGSRCGPPPAFPAARQLLAVARRWQGWLRGRARTTGKRVQ